MHDSLGQRLLFAGTLAVGFGLVWGTLASWAWELAKSKLGPQFLEESLSVTPNGALLIVERRLNGSTYRTLDGTPRDEPKDFCQGAVLGDFHAIRDAAPLSFLDRVTIFVDGRSPFNYWHFVRDGKKNGSAYFVGFDTVTGARVGYIGKGGFREAMIPHAERFRVSGTPNFCTRAILWENGFYPDTYRFTQTPGDFSFWTIYVTDNDGLHEVDLNTRSCRLYLPNPSTNPIDAGMIEAVSSRQKIEIYRLAIRMDDTITVRNVNGDVARRLALPEELRRRAVLWCELAGGGALATVAVSTGREPDWSAKRFYRFDAKDAVIETGEVLLSQPDPFWGERLALPMVLPGTMLIATYALIVKPAELLEFKVKPNHRAAIAGSLAELWPSILAATLLSALLAYACTRRERRDARRTGERIAWSTFVFLFGAIGYAGYLFHRRSPTPTTCPGCQSLVPRDRETCAGCGKTFVEPVALGIEIFA